MGPTSLFYNPSNDYVYVADEGAGFGHVVSLINGTMVVGTVGVGTGPASFVYDNASEDVYVVNSLDNTVSVIRGTANIANVSLGFQPSVLVYDPDNQYVYAPNVYAPNVYGNNVSVISGTEVIANLVTGIMPSRALYDPSNGDVYVSNSGTYGICAGGCPMEPSDVVSVIGGTSVLENVTSGSDPGALLYNPSDHSVFVIAREEVTVVAPIGS